MEKEIGMGKIDRRPSEYVRPMLTGILFGAISTFLNVSHASVRSIANTDSGTDIQTCTDCVASSSFETTYFSIPSGSTTLSSAATAVSTYGVLKSAAGVIGDGDSGVIGSNSLASYSDTFMISSSALNGTWGKMFVPIAYSYSFSASSPQVAATYTLAIDCIYCGDITLIAGTWDSTPRNVSGVATAEVPFLFGEQFDLEVSQFTGIGGNLANGAFTGFLDAAHSSYWGGVSDVVDADGNTVAFSITSASGTDYRQSFIPSTTAPVPEPETSALMMAGFGVLGAVARGRKNIQTVAVA